MRVKKYFVSKYQKEAGKRTGVQTVIFGAIRRSLGSGLFILAFSNCNIGISFHDVMQNIFTVFWANFYVLTIGNTKHPFKKLKELKISYLKSGI